jgi:hypothetical protein
MYWSESYEGAKGRTERSCYGQSREPHFSEALMRVSFFPWGEAVSILGTQGG